MEKFYTENHEWVKVDGAKGVVGITEYASTQLGDITFIDIPEEGSSVGQGDFLCEIESVKAASDIYSPLTGEVLEVNGYLEDSPQLVNTSPEEQGWIVTLKIKDSSEVENLMREGEYREYIGSLR